MKKLLALPILLGLSIIQTALGQTPSPTINGTPPPFTFTGAGVVQSGQTFTFGGGGSSGFPITLGSTSVAASSTTTSISGLTLVAPALGTPTALVLTSATGLPAAQVLAGSLANGMAATTQSQADNSTQLATTAYVDTGLATKGTAPPYIKSYTYTSCGAGSVASCTTASPLTIATNDEVVVFCISSGSNSSDPASSSVTNTWHAGTLFASSTTLNSTMNYSHITSGGSSTFTCTPNVSEPFQAIFAIVIPGTTGTFLFENGGSTTGGSGSTSIFKTYATTTSGQSVQVSCISLTSNVNIFSWYNSGVSASIIPGISMLGPQACALSVVPYALIELSNSTLINSGSANQTWGIIGFSY